MQADGCNVLSHIFQDMIRDGVERTKRGARRKKSPAIAGFLVQLGKMMLPIQPDRDP
jgi:hypothetical protein